MRNDILYAWRTFRKNPAFALTAILALALGIGANTALFSVAYHVLRSLPYPHSDRLLRIYSTSLQKDFQINPSIPDFLDMRQQTASIEAMEAYRFGRARLGEDSELRVALYRTTPTFLGLIGAEPVLGRLLGPEDMKPDSPPVAVLGFEFWMSRYGRRDSAIGETIRLDGTEYTIIGVAEPVTGPLLNRFQLILPWILENDRAAHARGSRGIPVLARLRPDATQAQAQAELDAVGQALRQEYPDASGDWAPLAVSLYEETVEGIRPSLLALNGASFLILLIAVANISNLLLARGSRRRAEISIRVALGANQGRLARLLLTESLLLSLIGGAAGALLGWALLEAFLANSPIWIPRMQEIRFDSAVLLASFLASLLSGLLFGLAPVLALRKSSQAEGIRAGGGQAQGERNQLQAGLVVAQVALSLVLLTGSGLMIRSFLALRGVPLGIDYQEIVTFTVSGMHVGGFENRHARLQQFDEILKAIRSIPGVKDATVTSQAPLTGGWGSLDVEILTGPSQGSTIEPDLIGVTPEFFRFFGSQALQGRLFEPRDVALADSLVVVDANLADQIWPDLPAVGQRLRFAQSDAEVIGVVEPIRYGDLAEKMRPKLYNLAQHSSGAFGGTFLVRHAGDPEPIMAAIRSRLEEVDASLPLYSLEPLEAVYDRWLRQPRFFLLLMSSLGALALVQAAVGVYGVISYLVSTRTVEFGIRMALGADRMNILGLVCRQTTLLLAIGLACGGIGALWLTRYLQALLFQVEPTDPVALASMASVLAATAAAATLLPVHRALRVDPARTLRSE